MSAASSAGISRGMRVGLESVRQRRRQAEQDAMAAEDRQRRHEREDFSLERARVGAGREDTEWGDSRVDRQYELDERAENEARTDTEWGDSREDRDYTLKERERTGRRRTVLEGREDTEWSDSRVDRSHELETRDYDLRRARIGDAREDTEWQQGQEDRERGLIEDDISWMRQQLAADQALEAASREGLKDFAMVLKNGGDANFALSRFNRTGAWRIRPESFQFDRQSGRVKFMDNEGETFDGTLDELLRTAGAGGEVEPIKLSRNDRLVQPQADGSYRTLVDALPDADSGDGSGSGGGAGAGGRREATYNAESTQRQISNSIAEAFGGILGLDDRMTIADPDDRRKVTYLQSLGTDIEGRLRPYVMNGTLSINEIAEAVLQAGTSIYKTDSELERAARDAGHKAGTTGATAWIDAERTRQDALVRERLARAEQRLLGQAEGGPPAAAAGGDVKDVNSQAEYDALPSGARFRNGGQIYTKP